MSVALTVVVFAVPLESVRQVTRVPTITPETPFVARYRDSIAKVKSDSAFVEMTRHHPPAG